MIGIVPYEVPIAISGEKTDKSCLVDHVDRVVAHVLGHAVGKRKIANRLPGPVLQSLSRIDDLSTKRRSRQSIGQVGVRVGMAADFDAATCHPPQLFDRIRRMWFLASYVVRERQTAFCVVRRREIGAVEPSFDQQRNGMVGRFKVAIVERDRDLELASSPLRLRLLYLLKRNDLPDLGEEV